MTREELLQNAKPILFNTEMVTAILNGRKTVTRRLVKPRSKNACGFYVTFRKSDNAFMGVYDYDENERQFDNSQTPPACVGDILYVRETWKKAPNGYFYYEDWLKNDIADVTKWKPSIHMPKEAARIFLKVKNVRVERLQDMDKIDAIKEGIDNRLCVNLAHALTKFKKLWNSTIKKADLEQYGWDASPWVWVIEFERVKVINC